MTITHEAHRYPAAVAGAGPEATAAWDDFCNTAGYGRVTRGQYCSIAKRFLRWLEPLAIGLREITPGHVDDFLGTQDISPITKTHYRSMLRQFFVALAARGIVDANPVTRAGLCPAEPPLTTDSLPGQFASFTAVERQATVDAAAFALLFHHIYLFSEGVGGQRANVVDCAAVLQLGEHYGITPLPFLDDDIAAATAPDGPAGDGP